MREKAAISNVIQILNDHIEPFSFDESSYKLLLDRIGDARFVLMGEATHGTKEFYETRCELTRLLIKHKGFMAVAIEADWPDVYHVHRYLQGKGHAESCSDVLQVFTRFPTWMWRNKTVLAFLSWLRSYNDAMRAKEKKIGFYGLDLYSLYSSIQAVIGYLKKIDPNAAKEAQERYACFDHLNFDPQHYGKQVSLAIKKSCIQQAVEQFLVMQHRASEYIKQNGQAEDEYFFATQNARVVKNAESYYRTMFSNHVSSWNIRDRHMFEILSALTDHLEKRFDRPAKIIIWAHNSHIGDARATEMSQKGEINIGQLVRELHGLESYHIGFSTYGGTVTAASDWEGPAEHKKLNLGLTGSYEDLFHLFDQPNLLLDLRANEHIERLLYPWRLQRAVGVVYRPETERFSHYFFVRLPYQFDTVLHFDHTNAVEPL